LRAARLANPKSITISDINKYKMKPAQLSAAQTAVANKATHEITFEAALPPVGFSTFEVKKAAEETAVVTTPVEAASVVSNGVYGPLLSWPFWTVAQPPPCLLVPLAGILASRRRKQRKNGEKTSKNGQDMV